MGHSGRRRVLPRLNDGDCADGCKDDVLPSGFQLIPVQQDLSSARGITLCHHPLVSAGYCSLAGASARIRANTLPTLAIARRPIPTEEQRAAAGWRVGLRSPKQAVGAARSATVRGRFDRGPSQGPTFGGGGWALPSRRG